VLPIIFAVADWPSAFLFCPLQDDINMLSRNIELKIDLIILKLTENNLLAVNFFNTKNTEFLAQEHRKICAKSAGSAGEK